MSRRLIVTVLLAAALVATTLHAAPPHQPSRGITAGGRVITSPFGVWPPWRADIIRQVKAHYPDALRAQHPVVTGFFRIILDLQTGHVRHVVVARSSGYPAGDASIIAALQQWQFRPNRWREFEAEVSIGIGSKPPASNQAMQPTAGRSVF